MGSSIHELIIAEYYSHGGGGQYSITTYGAQGGAGGGGFMGGSQGGSQTSPAGKVEPPALIPGQQDLIRLGNIRQRYFKTSHNKATSRRTTTAS